MDDQERKPPRDYPVTSEQDAFATCSLEERIEEIDEVAAALPEADNSNPHQHPVSSNNGVGSQHGMESEIAGCREKVLKKKDSVMSKSVSCDCLVCERRKERTIRNKQRMEAVSSSLQRCSLNIGDQNTDAKPCIYAEQSQHVDMDRTFEASQMNEFNGDMNGVSEDYLCREDLELPSRGNSDRNYGDDMENYGDDMENYFNANRHVLEPAPENNRNVHHGSVWTYTHHFPQESMNRVHDANSCDNDDIDEGGVYVCDDDKHFINHVLPANIAPDDEGDFIEADIPANVYKGIYPGSSSNNSRNSTANSSYEDLRTLGLSNGRAQSEDDHSYEDLRLLDIKPPRLPGHGQPNEHRSLNSLSNENQSDMRISNGENILHTPNLPLQDSSNVNNELNCRPKNLYGESLLAECNAAIEENSPLTSVTGSESSHRTLSSSFLSPQLSDSAMTFGIASESSVFMSPDNEADPLATIKRAPLLRHRSVDCHDVALQDIHNCGEVSNVRAVRSSNDLPSASNDIEQLSVHCLGGSANGLLDMDNIDNSLFKVQYKEKAMNLSGIPRNSRGKGPCFGCKANKSSSNSKKSGRWTNKIVRTGEIYQQNPERYTSPMICGSVYEAWAETRVRNMFYNEEDSFNLESSNSSSEDEFQSYINNLNMRRTSSSDNEELFNVSRQTSTSNFDQDENSFQEGSGSQMPLSKSSHHLHKSSMSCVGDCQVQAEHQENQNNINLECGERYKLQASQGHMRGDPEHLQRRYHDMKQTILKRKRYKKRVKTVYLKGKPTRHKLVKFKMRPGQIFQALDYDYIHFNYSQSEESSSSGDCGSDSDDGDGYVDFQILLRNYMIQRLHERYSWPQLDDSGSDSLEPLEKVMVWNEFEAYMTHIRQIGASACGATALINVLRALDIKMGQERVCEHLHTNVRAEDASLTQYILSRSVAGTTASQLIEAMEKISKGCVRGRFFHMYPARAVAGGLRRWLATWMKKGAVAVVTLNRQKAVPIGYEMPDAWHHQMVFGVGPKGVYLTNPQEIIPEYVVAEQLCSDGILKVRRKDVVSRWAADCDLMPLLSQPDPRWNALNVLGQLVHLLREEKMGYEGSSSGRHGGTGTAGQQAPAQVNTHVTIPAWYQSGITLFIKTSNTELCQELAIASDFPLLHKPQ